MILTLLFVVAGLGLAALCVTAIVAGVGIVVGATSGLGAIDVFIGGLFALAGVLGLLGLAGLATGEIKFDGPLAVGCYKVDIASSTTYVLSGKVIVPITTKYNTFFPIPCPA